MAVVKLCGIKSEEDAALMNEVKPEYVGFVFAPGKHQISAASACRLSNIIRYSRLVGVFVNEQPAVIAKIAKQTGLDVIVQGLRGGSGKRIAMDLLQKLDVSRLIIAGGICRDNVKEILALQPYGIDVSSALETNGKKDKEKVRTFMKQLKG